MAMPTEKKKRQSGDLHDLHIRIPQKVYDDIIDVCEKEDITIAEYFNKILMQDGYNELIRVAEKIAKEPVPYKLVMDDDVRRTYDGLVEALNGCTSQTRRIGTNLSALIRDVRTGKVRIAPEIYFEVKKMREANEELQKKYYEIASKLLAKLDAPGTHIEKIEKYIPEEDPDSPIYDTVRAIVYRAKKRKAMERCTHG